MRSAQQQPLSRRSERHYGDRRNGSWQMVPEGISLPGISRVTRHHGDSAAQGASDRAHARAQVKGN